MAGCRVAGAASVSETLHPGPTKNKNVGLHGHGRAHKLPIAKSRNRVRRCLLSQETDNEATEEEEKGAQECTYSATNAKKTNAPKTS